MAKYVTGEMLRPGRACDLVSPSHNEGSPNEGLSNGGSISLESPDTGSLNMGYSLTRLATKVANFIFPAEEGCVLCKKAVSMRNAEEIFYALICGDCLSRIPFVEEPICKICGRPLRGHLREHLQGQLRRQSPGRLQGHLKGQLKGQFQKHLNGQLQGQLQEQPRAQRVIREVNEGSKPGGASVCNDCSGQGRFFFMARAVGAYDGVLKDLICEFKFYGRRDLAEGLGVLMAREVSRRRRMRTCDIIVPVPLHPIRLAERGYNQAELLAGEVASCFGIPVKNSMERVIRWGEQNKLGRQLRQDHIRGAFNVPHPGKIAGKRVLLVDDVITTGNTANECARALLRAGAVEICVIAAAISV